MLTRNIYLPTQYALDGKVLKSPIRQLLQPEFEGTVTVQDFREDGVAGQLLVTAEGRRTLVIRRKVTPPSSVDSVIVIPRGKLASSRTQLTEQRGRPRWLKPLTVTPLAGDTQTWATRREEALASWIGQFRYQEDQRVNGQRVGTGLRIQQMGALHSVLGHWRATNEPATIVMPTGTGKTETMLALLINDRTYAVALR